MIKDTITLHTEEGLDLIIRPDGGVYKGTAIIGNMELTSTTGDMSDVASHLKAHARAFNGVASILDGGWVPDGTLRATLACGHERMLEACIDTPCRCRFHVYDTCVKTVEHDDVRVAVRELVCELRDAYQHLKGVFDHLAD